jgi:hypothetical protein
MTNNFDDFFLNFLNSESNNIIIKNELYYFLDGEPVEYSKLKKRIIKRIKFISEIKTNKEFNLLIKDEPLNFLLYQTILIGNECELVKYRIKTNPKTIYVSNYETLNLLKDLVQINTIEKITEDEKIDLFKNIKIIDEKTPKIILKYRKFILDKKNIDLNKINWIKGNNLKLFCPNQKIEDLHLANLMGIPSFKFIFKNYIRETNINIFDNEEFEKILKPIKIIKNSKKEFLLKKDKYLNLYKEISSPFFIKITKNNKKEIIEIINKSTKTNYKKDWLISQIQKINKIKLSTFEKTTPLPIWKNSQEMLIPNSKEFFFEKFGISFEKDFNKLDRILVIGKSAKNLNFSKRFVQKQVFSSIKEIYEMSNTLNNDRKIDLIFNNPIDLIIKYKIIKNNNLKINKIYIKEKINENEILKLYKQIKKILYHFIKLTIKYNYIPKEPNFKDLNFNYLYSVENSIYNNYNYYLENKKYSKLLNITNSYLFSIRNYIKYEDIKKEDLYPISQIILNSLLVLKLLSKKKYDLINNIIETYFKDIKIQIRKHRINKKLESFISFQLLAKKNKNIKILIKNKELNQNILFENYIIKDNRELKEEKIFISLNNKKINNIFKFNKKEILEEIKNINKNDELKKKVILENKIHLNLKNKKKIILSEDFFEIKKIYSNFKIFYFDTDFEVLIKR